MNKREIKVKKRKSILTLGLVLIIMAVVIVWYYYPNTPPTEENKSDDSNYEPLSPPQLTIPEAPLGTLTFIIVCLAALAIFSRMKRKALDLKNI